MEIDKKAIWKAFDLILELGDKHGLFINIERMFDSGFLGGAGREEVSITMINPIRIIKRNC